MYTILLSGARNGRSALRHGLIYILYFSRSIILQYKIKHLSWEVCGEILAEFPFVFSLLTGADSPIVVVRFVSFV